jgi:tRNA(adenine34) deaminase
MPTETPAATAAADERAMRLALDQAQNAWLAGEVPVGAVIVRDDEQGLAQVVATGYNRPITTSDPTAHAEIVALRHAAELLGNYRVPECTLYVTLEPCAMCAMALMHARLKRVVFGARDPKTGAAGSVVDLFGVSALNHHTRVQAGCLDEACGAMLRDFFAERRAAQKSRHAASAPPVAAAAEGVPGAGAPPESEPESASEWPDTIPIGVAIEIEFPDLDEPRVAQ